GGRDWTLEARDVLVGPAFAVAFDADGERALVAGATGLVRGDGDRWRPIRAPAGTPPAWALAARSTRGRIYLGGPARGPRRGRRGCIAATTGASRGLRSAPGFQRVARARSRSAAIARSRSRSQPALVSGRAPTRAAAGSCATAGYPAMRSTSWRSIRPTRTVS